MNAVSMIPQAECNTLPKKKPARILPSLTIPHTLKAQLSSPLPLAAWAHDVVRMGKPLARKGHTWHWVAPATLEEERFAGQQHAANTAVRAGTGGAEGVGWVEKAGLRRKRVFVVETAGRVAGD